VRPYRYPVETVTSASASDWYICWASRLSDSPLAVTWCAADVCWLIISVASTPQARHRTTRPARISQSRPGVVEVRGSLNPRRGPWA